MNLKTATAGLLLVVPAITGLGAAGMSAAYEAGFPVPGLGSQATYTSETRIEARAPANAQNSTIFEETTNRVDDLKYQVTLVQGDTTDALANIAVRYSPSSSEYQKAVTETERIGRTDVEALEQRMMDLQGVAETTADRNLTAAATAADIVVAERVALVENLRVWGLSVAATFTALILAALAGVLVRHPSRRESSPMMPVDQITKSVDQQAAA